MNAAHIPGPWMVEPINGGETFQITSAESKHFAVIAETPVDGTGCDEANARLIATAPDLLAALRQCYAHLGWNPAKVPAHVADDARAAIAKAEGV